MHFLAKCSNPLPLKHFCLSFSVLGEVSTFLFLVFDDVLMLMLVDADSDGGECALTISLPLFLVVACDLVDVVYLVDGA
ncbi:hypothetical protein Tco_0793875 [Tanacetum coccineum]